MSIRLQGSSTTPYEEPGRGSVDLFARYQAIVQSARLGWYAGHRKLRLLGSGGQGVVFLSERQGADRFTLTVALKVFSPQYYRDAHDYQENMKRIAHVASRVALIQHDNVVDVYHFIEENGIRIMEMEWLDGYDLSRLLTPRMLDHARDQLDPAHWQYLNNVVVTAGPAQPRLKPGIAIQVLRECLTGLGALHREGIVHGDLKPSNIMLKRTGNAKVIDVGSAIDLRSSPGRRFWSPAYAAIEVLEGGDNSQLADLCSLGYVLIEMLAGRSPFAGLTSYRELLEAKRTLVPRLPELLPREVSCNELLLHVCQRLVEPDPGRRFPSAEAADLERKGAADFHRQLVKSGLASEYENDLRVWLEQLA